MLNMADDFLAKFMGNPARARLLRVFFFNQSGVFTVLRVAKRAGVTLEVATKEIKALEKMGILKRGKFSITLANSSKQTVEGKQKEQTWTISPSCKYAQPISTFVHQISPVHHDSVRLALKGTGRLSVIVLSGSFMGDSSRPADLIIVADGLNEKRLEQVVRKLEPRFGREIRYAAFSTPEFRYRLTIQDRLIRDTLDYPHLVLLDKKKLL